MSIKDHLPISTLNDPLTDNHGESIQNGVNETDGSNLFFEVEAIIDHCVRSNGSVEYLLKWKGFGEDENSWVSEEDMNAPALTRLYWSNKDMIKSNPKIRGSPIRSDRDRESQAKNNFDHRQESDSDATDIIQKVNGSSDYTFKDDDIRMINGNDTDGSCEINNNEIPNWLKIIDEESKSANYYFKPNDHDSWENHATILNIVRETDAGDNYVHIKWPDGTDSYFITSEVYQKCPLK
ncbi:2605_t:CDS:2, partial [Funneliformis geosporum]